jgi:hypothetical protein
MTTTRTTTRELAELVSDGLGLNAKSVAFALRIVANTTDSVVVEEIANLARTAGYQVAEVETWHQFGSTEIGLEF